MKREDLKKVLTDNGVADDKLSTIVDFVMSENGKDLNALKEENSNLKSKYDEDIKSKDAEIKSYGEKLDKYKDYDELAKFKTDTLAKVDTDRKTDFLKSMGCKHPDLIMAKVDFTKATYDEEKKTYTGLDESMKSLKESYKDLFEEVKTQQLNPQGQSTTGDSDFFGRYKAEHPELNIK